MEMEVDETSGGTSVPSSVNRNALFLCYVKTKGGLKRSRMAVSNLEELSLAGLKEAVVQEMGTWEWNDGNPKPQNIDILHRSRVLKNDEDVKQIGPLSVVSVIRKDMVNMNSEEQHKSAKFISEYAASRNIHDQLTQVALALRTAFFNPKFVSMVENLGDSEKLENIFAIAPELRNDPIGIGIIQDPSLIYHLSDPDSLKKLANTRPWVIEAYNFLAASIHQERGSAQPQGIPSSLFNASLFDGEDESMDDGEDDEGGPGPSRGSGTRITREQVAAALSALGGGPRPPVRGLNLPNSNAFGGLFQPPAQQQAATSPSPNSGVAAAGANIQNMMNTLAGAGGGIPGQPLSSDVVARAVTDALRRLTPEQRADQLSAIRNFATQLQQQSGGGGTQQQTQSPPAAVAAPAPQQTQQGGSPSAQQYQSQLSQMRDLGITDERLSILALRVSEGDVNTAAELIFSGWTGEGSDPV